MRRRLPPILPPVLQPALRAVLRAVLLPVLAISIAAARPATAGAAESAPAGRWPLEPATVVAPFAPPAGPYGPGHRGVDLLGTPGQAVRAARGGTVRFAGMLAGRPVVVVDDGTTRTTYEPVDPRGATRVGDVVAEGALLGRLEAAPSHCAPRACLHWGWIRDADDAYLDPLDLVGGGPVRLLPLAAPGTAPVPEPVPAPAAKGVVPPVAAARAGGLARSPARWW